MTNANESAMPLNEYAATIQYSSGLTKREYFAAMALQGLLANSSHSRNPIHAHDAVQLADALINALNETK